MHMLYSFYIVYRLIYYGLTMRRGCGILNIGKGVSDIKTRDMIMVSFFAALITAGAYIKIPISVCPFTLQFLCTTLAGILLGGFQGALAVGIYVLIGLAGVPVFTGGGGLSYVVQPTFGYLLGFIAGAFVTFMRLLLRSGDSVCYGNGVLLGDMPFLAGRAYRAVDAVFVLLFAGSPGGHCALHIISRAWKTAFTDT